jgi:lipopolysaccharide biosynthesis glycosyltransferase
MKNKNLLVTLAKAEQAKQLFSSVYWNAGWKGDYMLLTPENELSKKQLSWFRKKGILIKKCRLLPDSDKSRAGKWPPVVFNKLYIFTPEFKKWENIILIEADTIVRSSLEKLTKIKGFAAVGRGKLSEIFLKPLHIKLEKVNKKIYQGLKKNYNLNKPVFNAGMLAFNTSIIKDNTFSELKNLLSKYIEISAAMEESILNLYFYKKWEKLPIVYNLPLFHFIDFKNIKPEKIKGIVLHFHKHKPWNPKNYFYKEWKNNLEKAEQINLKKPQKGKNWTDKETREYSKYLENKPYSYKYILFRIRNSIDRYTGLFGIFLKNNFPKLYYKLKNYFK